VSKLGRAILITPLYVSLAWTMMISYQMFTQTAVLTVLTLFNTSLPAVGEWLLLRMDLIVFIYAFAWVFVLSSVIPSLLLGRERSVLVQFFVCLILTLTAFLIQDIINAFWNSPFQILHGFVVLLDNPLLAVAYLSLPYVTMLAIDIQAKKRQRTSKQMEEITARYLGQTEEEEQEVCSENTRPQDKQS
jgi:hypothetical protein